MFSLGFLAGTGQAWQRKALPSSHLTLDLLDKVRLRRNPTDV